MSGSVSPLPWTGNKGCIYTTIDAFMPPHKTYVEACMGSAEVFLRKRPVEREIINDFNGDLVRFFRVLQRNENQGNQGSCGIPIGYATKMVIQSSTLETKSYGFRLHILWNNMSKSRNGTMDISL